jgi:Leucine-rich repeat (LRR) protein
VNLKELILSSNQITELPSSIGLLEQLEALRIEENALTNLPESIGQLTRLHTLTAHTNALVSLPVSFSRLNNLSNLDLKKNSLTSFCDQQLATLSNLKFLDLRQNKLVVFPLLPKGSTLDQVFLGYNQLLELNEESILRVKDSITVFDIRDNKLSNLPAKLACLFKLKTLDLSNNDLSDLPPGLGYLKNLNHILIDGNPLRAIRRSILTAGCESLKKYLRTRGSPPKGVDVMEEEVDELEYLRREKQAIDGCKTPRTNIENDISIYRDAAATGTLDLSGRQWKELPIEITTQPFGTMETTLLHLNFSKNTLSHLPSELIRLIHLKTLIVEENRLQNLDPLIASQMKHLQFLRLKKNYLNSHVIDHFFQHTKGNKGLSQSLKELDLRNNQLIEMPMSLRFLQALDTLQLSYNQLKTLDGFPFHELRMTATISLSDNKVSIVKRMYTCTTCTVL